VSELIEMSGHIEGTTWEVVRRAKNYRDGRARWECVCLNHPYEVFVVFGTDIRAKKSKSCKHCSVEAMQQAAYGGNRVKKNSTTNQPTGR
jgi:hypothetical protein